MFFQQIFEPKLAQYSYLIGCQRSGEAIVIDPMRDIERYVQIATSNRLKIVAVAETHIHADYLSGMRQFAHDKGVKVYASDEGDADWKYNWLIGSDFDYQLLKDGDVFSVGNVELRVAFTPGHTPEHICFFITDRGAGAVEPLGVISGDFVFVGDVGRPDLLESAAGVIGAMEPSARRLGQSLQKFQKLSPQLILWPGHGAGSACGKALGAVPVSTVGYELSHNPAVRAASDLDAFVDYILAGQPEPPMYFARMKSENKNGPKIVEKISEPHHATAEEIAKLATRDSVRILDTRVWPKFCAGHIPGSLYTPMNSAFHTVVGSYVNPDNELYVIVDESRVQEVTLDLYRIGLDNVAGYVTPAEVSEYFKSGGTATKIDEISFEDFKASMHNPDVLPLDVRRQSEVLSTGALPGSVVFAHTRLPEHLQGIPKDKEILIFCESGSRSAYAAAYLLREGYRVRPYRGGFVDWSRRGEKIVEADSVLR